MNEPFKFQNIKSENKFQQMKNIVEQYKKNHKMGAQYVKIMSKYYGDLNRS